MHASGVEARTVRSCARCGVLKPCTVSASSDSLSMRNADATATLPWLYGIPASPTPTSTPYGMPTSMRAWKEPRWPM